MTADTQPQEITISVVAESSILLDAKLIKAVLGQFCASPVNGDDAFPQCSIGVAEDSVVATDSYSAIRIGKAQEFHTATQRRELCIELERAKQYGDSVRIDALPRLVDMQTGEAVRMPNVESILSRNLPAMKRIGAVDPEALAAIAAVAKSAGASSVDLFQPEGDAAMLGFRFSFWPDEKLRNLFSNWDGLVPAEGVFRTIEDVKQTPLESKAAVEGEKDLRENLEQSAPRRGRSPDLRLETNEESGASRFSAIEKSEAVAYIDAEVSARVDGGHEAPPVNCLKVIESAEVPEGGEYRQDIERVLGEFNLMARVSRVSAGPTVTLYELTIPSGSASKKFAGMAADLALQLGVQSVRVEPIPTRKAIGLEIPNKTRRTVGLRDLCARRAFWDYPGELVVAIGEDLSGRPVYADLTTFPHLLVGGATNSGKSIGLASTLTSLVMRNSPDRLRFVMIDPKMVELSLFESLPHLMCPVITDVKEVPGVLRALVREMEHRYELLKEVKVRNLVEYNAVEGKEKMPYIVLVVDELADLMMQIRVDAEDLIVRLAQKARAVGIHLILATQRPSVDVVTGLIKTNVPSRIAFAVQSQIDSRVILDNGGAEQLIGRGDMLFVPMGGTASRVQGAYVSTAEVEAVCAHWAKSFKPAHTLQPLVMAEPEASDDDDDPLYDEAVLWVRERGQASTSMLQRRFSIGFQRANRLLSVMEASGVVGPKDGPRPREVLPA